MGKNAGFKAQQAARHSGGDGAPASTEAGDGMVDASFHTAEWHAARLASLTVGGSAAAPSTAAAFPAGRAPRTGQLLWAARAAGGLLLPPSSSPSPPSPPGCCRQVERPSYEEWKRKQKEEQDKQDRLAGDEEQLMSGWLCLAAAAAAAAGARAACARLLPLRGPCAPGASGAQGAPGRGLLAAHDGAARLLGAAAITGRGPLAVQQQQPLLAPARLPLHSRNALLPLQLSTAPSWRQSALRAWASSRPPATTRARSVRRRAAPCCMGLLAGLLARPLRGCCCSMPRG
jgi:hypothetical protein